MRLAGLARLVREVLLTAGAILGAVCLLATIAGAAVGVKPLVVMSGSMSPAVPTGALAISRTVDAVSLDRGDIVSVTNRAGVRVTHRVIDVASQGAARQLTLKGDANTRADAESYTVTRAERVVLDVPLAGYVVNAAMTPAGALVLGVYVAWMVVLLLRRPPDDRDRDRESSRRGGARRASRPTRARAAARAAVAAVAVAAVGVAGPAAAAWVDDVPITGTTFSARVVPAPTSLQCSTSGFLIASATLRWASAGPGLSYLIEVRRDGILQRSTTVTGTSYTLTGGFLENLVSTNLVATVQAFPAGAQTWQSQAASTNVRARTLGTGVVCGHL